MTISDQEWKRLKTAQQRMTLTSIENISVAFRTEVQWMLDLLRRENGRLSKEELDAARQAGFNINGIKALGEK